MSSFDEAQRLFAAYENERNSGNLRDSLDLLDELILNNDADSQRAINFKKTILRTLENQIRDIKNSRNIPDFAKHIGPSNAPDYLDKAAEVIAACCSREDFERILELLSIKTAYFKQPD